MVKLEQARTVEEVVAIFDKAVFDGLGMHDWSGPDVPERLRTENWIEARKARMPNGSLAVLAGILADESGPSLHAAGLNLVFSQIHEVLIYAYLFALKEIEIAAAVRVWEAEGMDENKMKKKVAKLGMTLKGEVEKATGEIRAATGLQAMLDALEESKKSLKGAKKK